MDSLIIFGGQGRSSVICAYAIGYALGGVENMSLAMGEYLRVQALCFEQVELYIQRIRQRMQEKNEVLRVFSWKVESLQVLSKPFLSLKC